VGVVEVQGMGDGPVDQGRIQDAGFQAVSQDRSLRLSSELPGGFDQDLAQGLPGPPQGRADEIQEAALPLVDHIFGEGTVGRFYHVFGDSFGYLHYFLLRKKKFQIPGTKSQINPRLQISKRDDPYLEEVFGISVIGACLGFGA
jgi:hypothetical protein